jgi:hypothetical protein
MLRCLEIFWRFFDLSGIEQRWVSIERADDKCGTTSGTGTPSAKGLPLRALWRGSSRHAYSCASSLGCRHANLIMISPVFLHWVIDSIALEIMY